MVLGFLRRRDKNNIKVSGRKFRRSHALVVSAFFGIVGILIISGAFAATCSSGQVCIDSPVNGAVYSDDFRVQLHVNYQLGYTPYHIKVWLDQGTPGEQLIDVRKKTTDLVNGRDHFFDFYYGNPMSNGGVDTLSFDRQLIPAGVHSITAEMYNDEVPLNGVAISKQRIGFTVTNVKNLQASTESPRTFNSSQFPLSGSTSPRMAKESPRKNLVQKGIESVENSISVLDRISHLSGKAEAHSGVTGYRHGDFDVLTNLDGVRYGIPGVTVSASHPTEACSHNGSIQTTNYDGVASFRMCGVSSNGGTGATYTVTMSNTPSGYSLNDVATKQIYVPWNSDGTKKVTIAFNYKRSATPVPPTPTCYQAPVPNIRNNHRTPLYRFWSGSWQDHVYQTTQMDQGGLNVGYCYEGHEGYVYPNQIPGTVELARYFNSAVTDHLLIAGRDDASYNPHGYYYEGPVGNIATTQLAGTVPLYRFWNGGILDHFYTTNYFEGANAGYILENVTGYVWQGWGSYNVYNPPNPPLLSLTKLASDKVTFDAFGIGMSEGGFPDVKTVNSVTVTVDGTQTDSHTLTGRQYQTLVGETAYVGNLNDGLFHTVILKVSAINGQTATLTFKVDPAFAGDLYACTP